MTSLAALYFNGPLWMLGVLLFIGWTGTGSFPLFMGVVPGETVSRSLAATSMGLVVCIGEFGRSPQRGVSTSGNQNNDDGRDHWPYCYTSVIAGAGIKRGYVHGKSDKTASAPVENPVHPTELLATIYHAVGIKPDTIVYNHLNQPRELVKGEVVTGVLA